MSTAKATAVALDDSATQPPPTPAPADLLRNDPPVAAWWQRTFGDSLTTTWAEFQPAFYALLGLKTPAALGDATNTSDPVVECRLLKALLAKDGESVTKKRLNDLLGWFGPLVLPYSEAKGMLRTILAVCKDKAGGHFCWFHGDTSTTEAESRLKGLEPGSFLIRFSNNPQCPTWMTVSRVSKRDNKLTISHIRIDHKPGGQYVVLHKTSRPYTSLLDLVRAECQRSLLGLTVPAKGSPFQDITDQGNSDMGGYQFDLEDDDDDDLLDDPDFDRLN